MTDKIEGDPPHVRDLLHAVEYALEVLDNYSDVDDGDDGRPVPNRAMLAYTELKDAYQRFIRIRVQLHGEPE